MANVWKVLSGSNWAVAFATAYYPVFSSGKMGLAAVTTEANVAAKAIDATTLSNLVAHCSAKSSASITVRSRNNAANGNQSFTVSATGWSEDTTHTDSVTAANTYSIQGDSTGQAMGDTITFDLQGFHLSVSGSTLVTSIGGASIAASGSDVFSTYGTTAQTPSTSESTTVTKARHAITLDHFRTSTATYSSSASTQQVRKNSANGNQSVSVSGTDRKSVV